MVFSTANIGLGLSFAGVGAGVLSLSLVGRFGVADGLSLAVGDVYLSAVATGDGAATTLVMGVGAGYLLLVSELPTRVMSHAIRTPEAPSTRTIANTHGSAPLRDSILA